MRFFFLLLLSLAVLTVSAQKVDKFIYLGKEAELQQDYLKAATIYLEGARISLKNPELNFSLAECLRMLNDYSLAEKFYQLTLSSDTANKYPIALFWLATLQKNNGRYKEALANWELLKRQNENNPKSETYLKAEHEVVVCGAIIRARIPSYPVEVVNLVELNSTDVEFAGSYYNGYSMVYSKLLKTVTSNKPAPVAGIKTSIKENGNWRPIGQLSPEINEEISSNANGNFSSDGKFFLFTRCQPDKACQLYISRYKDGSYSKAFPLKLNSPGYSSTQPCLIKTSTGYVLFFSSNRPGGKGGYDIWYSISDEELDFGEPKNIETINSIEDDITPFYFPLTGELFFSSTWFTGLGGQDIFKSYSRDLITFTEPKNIGKPFNSPANDTYFVLEGSGYQGLLTSNRVGSFSSFGSTCCNDIYEFAYPLDIIGKYPYDPEKAPEIVKTDQKKTQELLSELKSLLPLTLYFHNDEPDPKSVKNYTLKTYLDCYVSYLQLKPAYQANNSQTDALYKEYIDAGFNKLYRYLELTRQLMGLGVDLTISVKGYASPLAKSDYNVNLTGRRIESFLNYLKAYQEGALLPYLGNESGKNRLSVVKVPFGEERSATGVSDNYYDQRKSVYSTAAAAERRIEIVATELGTQKPEKITESLVSEISNQPNKPAEPESAGFQDASDVKTDTSIPTIASYSGKTDPVVKSDYDSSPNGQHTEEKTDPQPEDMVIPEPEENFAKPEPVYLTNRIEADFGKVKRGQILAKPLKFRNSYGSNITMTRVKSDCECAKVHIPTGDHMNNAILVPDEEIVFTVVFDSKGKLGVVEHIITIFTKEISGQIEIKFRVEVVP